jgi:hypothetical protein
MHLWGTTRCFVCVFVCVFCVYEESGERHDKHRNDTDCPKVEVLDPRVNVYVYACVCVCMCMCMHVYVYAAWTC